MRRLSGQSRRCAGSLVGALLPLVAHAAVAVAQADEEPVTISYRASDGCPDQAAFISRVRARTKRARLVPRATGVDGHRAFDVQIEDGRPASGQLTLGDPVHPEGKRRVRAETCEEVVDALALVAALAIDPSAPAEAAAPASPDEGSRAAAASTAPPPIPPPATAPPVDWGRITAARSAPDDSPPRGASVNGSSKVAFDAGLDAAFDQGVSPVTLVGLSPYVGWQSRSTAPFSLALHLAFDRAQSGRMMVPNGSAAFTWTVGRLDVCPLRGFLHGLRVAACARIDAGTLEVAGGDIVAAQTRSRLWLSAGAEARGEWTFFEPLFLNVEAGGTLRATNDRFFFLPETTVYQVPIVGVSAAAGLGAHFL